MSDLNNLKDNKLSLSLEKFFKEKNINPKNKTFVIAVSTGVDSAVLLDLFLKAKDDMQIANIVICHVNHHRRSESEEEARYIKEYSEENNVKLYIKDLYFEDDSNFQENARKQRYEFFDEIVAKENADYLVLAHHGDDNVETIIMRLLRGSSLSGYSGISDVSTRQKVRSYKVIRPLLSYSKDDIINYQKMHKIKYYEDSSNSENDYTRNRVRHNIIPALKHECDDLVSKLNEFSSVLKEASNVINYIRDEYISNNVIFSDVTVINRDSYLKLSDYMKEEVLFEVLKKHELSKANICELIKIIKSDKVNFKFDFKNKFCFMLEYDKIIIGLLEDNKINNFINIIIDKTGEYVINDNLSLIVCEKEKNTLTNNNEIWYNTKDFPIVLRTRKPGDKIKLKVGMKKVKDILIDKKIPQRERDNVLILEKDEDILALINICKSVNLTDIKETDVVIKLCNNK